MSQTAPVSADAVKSAAQKLDAHLREVIQWHFSPDTGTPFWLEWAKKAGWETLLNRAGTTFRKLPDKDKNGITAKKAIALMFDQPSMIKRPVLEAGGKLLVGFKPDEYAAVK